MLQKWRSHGAITFAGYILGFPADTKESILRDIEIIKRELPLDILEFFFLTPLPGSEDHRKQLKKGVWMDADINKYDLNHRVSHHSKMSDTEWEEAYRAAWDAFYTPDHIRTILRRAAAIPNGRPKQILSTIMWFKLMIDHEGVHPLEGGALQAEIAARPPSRPAARIAARLLSALLGRRSAIKACEIPAVLPEYAHNPQGGPRGARPLRLHVTSPSSRRRRTNSSSCRSITPPAGGEAALARKTLGDSIRDSAPSPADRDIRDSGGII